MALHTGIGLLEDARRAAHECGWRRAYEVLSQIDQEMALGVEDLEMLSTAAFLTGHGDESSQASLRAYQIRLNGGERHLAARAAVRIGLDKLDTAEIARASGCLPASLSSCSSWVAQASALLDDAEECVEDGYLLIPVAFEHLVAGGDGGELEDSVRAAEQAVEIGRRFGDPDLVAMAGMILGRALIGTRSGHHGMSVLEDSVAIVVTGEVSPRVAGFVLTAAVEAAHDLWDLLRFDRFVRDLARWCDTQDGMVQFRARSLTHQATLNRLHGRWETAWEYAADATHSHVSHLDQTALAEALYEQGELLRLRGELSAARDTYRRASRVGRDPQPGLALLRLLEGDADAAAGSIARAVAESNDTMEQARLLPAQVEILVEAGDLSGAGHGARALEVLAGTHDSPFLDATAHQSKGRVLLAEREAVAALRHLRKACRVWRHFDLPYEEARTRALMARGCQMLGDEDTGALERDAATRVFTQLGAKRDLLDVVTARAPADRHRLTNRELEVLRLVARGLTNRDIADQLMVAVRTVDSHVSNLFTKLGVTNRAAATAYAYRHDLA